MNAKPMPVPRTNIATDSATIEVCAPMSPKGIDAIVVTTTPNSAIGPPPNRSASLPANGMTSAIPIPCGAVSRPVSSTVSWRMPCQYSGSRIIEPNSAAPRQNIVSEAEANVARLYSRRSSSGLGTRSAWKAKATMSATPATHGPTTLAPVKPPVLPISASP